jgi:hypothetical protein
MQECLICKALLLKELLFEVLLIASTVIVVVIVVVVLVALVVLVCVLAPFILYKVHREVLRCLSTCKVTCREELRACGVALVISVVS